LKKTGSSTQTVASDLYSRSRKTTSEKTSLDSLTTTYATI
jgi:hypothetical protein